MKQCFRKTRKNKKNKEKQNNCFYLYFVLKNYELHALGSAALLAKNFTNFSVLI